MRNGVCGTCSDDTAEKQSCSATVLVTCATIEKIIGMFEGFLVEIIFMMFEPPSGFDN